MLMCCLLAHFSRLSGKIKKCLHFIMSGPSNNNFDDQYFIIYKQQDNKFVDLWEGMVSESELLSAIRVILTLIQQKQHSC